MSRQIMEKGKMLYLAAITCRETWDYGPSCRHGQQSPRGSKVGDRINFL